MRGDFARVPHLAVFPEVNALPGSERELAVVERDAEVHAGERGADVRGHVVVAFGGVDEECIAIGNEPREERLEIAPHVRVGVLLNEQRSGSVAQMQREQTVLKIIFGEPRRDFIGELVKTTATGGQREFVECLAQHERQG